MVWPLLLGAAKFATSAAGISAIGGIAGAAINSRARKHADWMNSPQGIRKNAEEAGFNPLIFAGVGAGTGAQYAPQMGSLISQTAATVGDQLNAGAQLRIQRQQLEMENERLTRLAAQQVMRPRVAGIYEQRREQAAEAAVTQHNPDQAPPQAPWRQPLGYTMVRRPDGTPIPLERSIAERLDLTSGDMLMAEDEEALYGDVVSEATSVYNIFRGQAGPLHANPDLQGGNWFGFPSVRRRTPSERDVAAERHRERRRPDSDYQRFMRDAYPTPYN